MKAESLGLNVDFQHIVEKEPEPEKVDDGPGGPPMTLRECCEAEEYPPSLRKHLRFAGGALCLSALVLIGVGVFDWVGVGPALAAVGVAILYAQGSRWR